MKFSGEMKTKNAFTHTGQVSDLMKTETGEWKTIEMKTGKLTSVLRRMNAIPRQRFCRLL